MIRPCLAGLLLANALAACGDTSSHEQSMTPSVASPTDNSSGVGLNPEGSKTSPPASGASGASAPVAAMPARGPTAVDGGGEPDGPMDAGDRVLDAGMPVALSDAGDAGASIPSAEDAAAPDGAPRLPVVSSVDMDGPFETTIDESAGPERAGLVVRPAVLGEGGLKHPVFIWGPGRGTRVRDYEMFMRRIASHGFVVYSEISPTADGGEMLAAITWLIDENQRADSAYALQLDESRIGVGGHSFGSNSAMSASKDPRVKAFIHTAGSGFRGAGKALNLMQPSAFICGEDDPTANVTDCRTDFMQTSAPVFFTIIAGEDHLTTVRAGLPLVVAWLRWHLGDESERKSMFVGASCDFCSGVFTTQSKNWR